MVKETEFKLRKNIKREHHGTFKFASIKQ
jgi:hypothetical protein